MPDEIAERVDRLELPFDARGVDDYGVSKWHLTVVFRALAALYRNYFKVRCSGIEHVPAHGRAMLVGNHSGGIALDAAMVITACFLEMEPPRLAQGMAEKFINRFPFASVWAARCGQLTGLPEHAQRLLKSERLLLVFPEGALQTRSPIVPFAFLGGGDAIPTVTNLYRIGKLLGLPYLPVTPWLVPLPRPVGLSVRFGEAMRFEASGSEDDDTMHRYADEVKARIADLIERART